MFKFNSKIVFAAAVTIPLLLPAIAFAATLNGLLNALISVVQTIIPVIMGCAVLVFFWGIVKFIHNAGDEKAVEEGKGLMLWGMIGLFVMVALWGIIGYFQQQLNLNVSTASLGGLMEQDDAVPTP